MKIKGITIWERYLEYIVLGIAVLVFVGLTAKQFIGEPNAIEHKGQTYTPGNVDQLLREDAQRLQAKLTPDAAPEVAPPPAERVFDSFLAALDEPVSPDGALSQVQYRAPIEGGIDTTDVKPFVVAKIDAPDTVVAAQYFDALLPEVVDNFPELADRLPDMPYDMTWVTTAAKFNVANILQQYETGDPASGASAIPFNWYDGRIAVLNVVVEREELVNGEWTGRTTLEPIPGQFSLRDRLAERIDASERGMLLREATDQATAESLLRPEFYATKNQLWTPPSFIVVDEEEVLAAEDDEQRRINEQRRRLRILYEDRDRLEARLDDLGGPMNDDGGRPGAGDGGGERGGSGASGGGGRNAPGGGGGATSGGGRRSPGGESGANEANQERTKRARIRLTRNLDVLNRRIADLERELGAMDANAIAQEQDVAVDDGVIEVWAHDIDATPGSTYRYRFTIELFNPFFQRKFNLVDEQKELADSIVTASPASEWSKPVETKPFQRVWVVDAKLPEDGAAGGALGGLGLGRATAEVIRFHDGRWWEYRFAALEPGDRIGNVREIRLEDGSVTTVDFGTGWYVLDILKDIDSGGSDGATVLLQSLEDSMRQDERDPDVDSRAQDRAALKEEVRMATS